MFQRRNCMHALTDVTKSPSIIFSRLNDKSRLPVYQQSPWNLLCHQKFKCMIKTKLKGWSCFLKCTPIVWFLRGVERATPIQIFTKSFLLHNCILQPSYYKRALSVLLSLIATSIISNKQRLIEVAIRSNILQLAFKASVIHTWVHQFAMFPVIECSLSL